MRTVHIIPFTATFFLTILISIFCSCKIEHNSATEKELSNSKSSISTKDSILGLKPSRGIRSILEDRNGNLWFGSTEWTCCYDGEKYTYFTEKDGLCFKDSRIQEDKNGVIWIQSGKNLCSYDDGRFSFHTLNQNKATDKWNVEEKDLWFHRGFERHGNWEGKPGTYRLRNGEFTFLNFPVPQSEHADQLYLVSSGPHLAKDGTLWFGTMEALIGYKEGNFTFIGREEMGLQDDPRNIGIRGIYEDTKGRIWLADNGCGLFVYDGDTTVNFTKIHKLDKGDRAGNTLHRTFSVAEDNEGNMWFGTVYAGIWKFDGTSFENFSVDDGVISQNIWTIYKTKNGDLYFAGVKPGAVYKFNGESFDRKY